MNNDEHPDWELGECRKRHLPLNAFFYEECHPRSSKGYQRARERARKVCGACEIQAECAEFAIGTNQIGGMWGGLTFGERADERSRRFRLAQGTLQGPLAVSQSEERAHEVPLYVSLARLHLARQAELP